MVDVQIGDRRRKTVLVGRGLRDEDFVPFLDGSEGIETITQEWDGQKWKRVDPPQEASKA